MTQIPLTIEIPPGMARRAFTWEPTKDRPWDKLSGVSNHPEVKTIPLFVKFLIEK